MTVLLPWFALVVTVLAGWAILLKDCLLLWSCCLPAWP